MKAGSIGNWCPFEAKARSRGPLLASHASGSASSHRRWSGSRSAIRSATTPMPAEGIITSRGFTRRFAPSFALAADMAHATAMASPDGILPARRRPLVRRLMLRDFRSYAALDLVIEGRLVVLCGENGAGKTNLLEALSLLSPGRGLQARRTRRMRAERWRRRLRALGRSRGRGRDPSARLRLEPGGGRRRRTEEPGRPGVGPLLAGLRRSCPRHLADACDGFAVLRSSERAAPVPRPLRAGDRARTMGAGSGSSSGRSADATDCLKRVRATPPGSTRSSAKLPSSASRSLRRGSNASAGSRR